MQQGSEFMDQARTLQVTPLPLALTHWLNEHCTNNRRWEFHM